MNEEFLKLLLEGLLAALKQVIDDYVITEVELSFGKLNLAHKLTLEKTIEMLKEINRTIFEKLFCGVGEFIETSSTSEEDSQDYIM